MHSNFSYLCFLLVYIGTVNGLVQTKVGVSMISVPNDFVSANMMLCLTTNGGSNVSAHDCDIGIREFISISEDEPDFNTKIVAEKPWDGKKVFLHTLITSRGRLQQRKIVDVSGLTKENGPLYLTNDELNGADYVRYNMSLSLMCDDHYYNEDCTVKCTPPLNNTFYTCNPETGVRDCDEGWMGDLCQYKQCSYCVHGVCRDDDENSCRCLGRWFGRSCELCPVAENCANGYCVVPGECKCYKGWSGELCNVADHCKNTTCLNDGVCQSAPLGGVNCQCKDGFTGDRCQFNLFHLIGTALIVTSLTAIVALTICYFLCVSQRMKKENQCEKLLDESSTTSTRPYIVQLLRKI